MPKIIDDDLLTFMGEQESQYLIKPSDLISELRKRYHEPQKVIGDCLPWSKTNQFFRYRAGEVTLFAGINGHGKSSAMGQICAWGLNSKWLIASMEMAPEETLNRMILQIAGNGDPPLSYKEHIANWMDNHLWIYDQTDSVKLERILAVVRYAIAHDIQHVVIDSLIKCGIRRDDFVTQAWFVDKLCWLAKTHKIHIHLVHHIRKGEDEKRIPGKFDIRGAAEITDLVDNVLIWHRNKSKEEKTEPDEDEADCFLKIAKQRQTGWEGIFKLYYRKDSGQISSDPTRNMTHWKNNNELAIVNQ